MTVIEMDRLSERDCLRLLEDASPHVRGRARLELARRRAREREQLKAAQADNPDERVHPVHAMSAALALTLLHLEAYACAFEREFDCKAGTDAVIGSALCDALRAVRRLTMHSQIGYTPDLIGAAERIAREHAITEDKW